MESVGVGDGDLGKNEDRTTGSLCWIWEVWGALSQKAWDLGILRQWRFDGGLWDWCSVGEKYCYVVVLAWTE